MNTEHTSEEEPASIVPVEAAKTPTSFFSFADPGGYVWWAGIVLGALAACCLAAIVVIAVKSATRTPLQPVLDFLVNQSCPSLSPLAATPVAFTNWLPACRVLSPGAVFSCYSREDCVMLPSNCVAPSARGLMTCEPEARLNGAKVCKLGLTFDEPVQALPNGGFCTSPDSQCAWCADKMNCATLSTCVPRSACNSSTHPSSWQCR